MMKSLFEVNKRIREYERAKKYIYGTDRRAWWLFIQCCSLRISIEGFVDNDCDVDRYFNKRIVKEAELDDEAVLFVPKDFEENLSFRGTKIFCDHILDLNIENTDKKIVIYGAGVCGKLLLKHLKEWNMDVVSFVETTVGKNTNIDGVVVQSAEMLQNITDDTIVICAGRYYEEMYQIVQKYAPDTECYYVTLGDLYIYYDKSNIVFDRREGRRKSCIGVVSNFEEFFAEKTIWLYGDEYQMLCDDKTVYNLLGYVDIVIATDDGINGTKNISDYSPKENAVILVYSKNKVEKLQALGLKEGQDYIWGGVSGINKIRTKCYDINLGQSYKTDGKTDGEYVCPGIYRYGAHEETDFIIMVLGGSTSEEVRELWKTWPYILYQKFVEQGKKVTIYNCANTGYNAAQELLCYLRDGATIHPDLIISYSGANDTHNLYGTGFNLCVLRNAGEVYTSHCGYEMSVGLEDKRDVFEIWVDHLKCIHALASVRGSKYIAFAHPLFGAKNTYNTQHEKRLIKKVKALYCEEDLDGCIMFREKVRNVHEDFIVDFTGIFDDEDVYYDICHVYEKGNYIIASKIYEELMKRGLVIL